MELEKHKEKEEETISEIEDEKKKNGNNILKLVLTRNGERSSCNLQFGKNYNAHFTINDTNEEHKFIASTSKNSSDTIGKIRVRNMRDLFTNEASFIQFKKNFLDKILLKQTKRRTSGRIRSTRTNTTNVTYSRKEIKLQNVEMLYNKYFNKSIQDTIVIIACILSTISISNKHHKARMDESFKKINEAEIQKDRYDANKIHSRHKQILEAKLKANFVNVMSSIDEVKFDPVLQMLLLSILNVLVVLDRPKINGDLILKNLVFLLRCSLNNSKFKHSTILELFRSKNFHPNCIELIGLIENKKKYYGVAESM